MANFCSNCGSPLSGDVKFCSNCGAAVAPNASTVQSDSAAAAQSALQAAMNAAQPTAQPDAAKSQKEDKVYFEGMVNKTRCVICSTNWYLGNDKIIPVTSVAAVQYKDMSSMYKLCGVFIIMSGVISILPALTAGITALIVIGFFMVVLGILMFTIKKGGIWVQTNSIICHTIECDINQYKRCLDAMNKCLSENR